MANKDLKFSLDFKTLVDPKEYFDDLKHPIGRAVTDAMRDVSESAKEVIREDVRRNFRNRMTGKSHFDKSFRNYDYPHKKSGQFSYSPAATLQANASWADVFEEGGYIWPSKAKALAIPTRDAEKLGLHEVYNGRGGMKRLSQVQRAEQMFGDLFTVEKDEETYLAAKDKKTDETIFLFNLRPWTKQKKRISLERRSREAFALLPAKFKKHFPDT